MGDRLKAIRTEENQRLGIAVLFSSENRSWHFSAKLGKTPAFFTAMPASCAHNH
jgi:hypothetical protein